ncbi:AAA family ATPase [Lentibacillus salinarum]|uniref:CpaE family protein n=1 Tax=Lentibacillus salinarum TaxID=446820 RepID=A0ABW3ZXT0_9BACI
MMIAVWSAKGGVGTSALTLGLAKAMQEDNPVLMDFNVFSPTLAALMGLEDTQYGLDRVFLHSDAETIEKALHENWVQQEGFSVLPGVQYPPTNDIGHTELLMRTIKEATKDQTVIVDAGSGVAHPLQKELLLRADVILVVVTPYLMTYHNLWRMWQNDFFIPYEQTKKAGLIVNQYQGSVTSKDIATLTDLWLAGDLPVMKKMTDALNQGNLDEAFPKAFLKKLKDIGERSTSRMEQTNTMVKQIEPSSSIETNDTTETKVFSYEQREEPAEWVMPDSWGTESPESNQEKWTYPMPDRKEEWHFES